MDPEARVKTRIRQIRSMILKAEHLAQIVELKSEQKNRPKEYTQELEELNRRLRKLRQMLRSLKDMRGSIQNQDTVDKIKLLLTRYDQCVQAVDLAMVHNVVRSEQKNMRLGGRMGEGTSLMEPETQKVQVNGQQITVPMTRAMQDALDKSRKLQHLRKDVSEVLGMFQDVKEIVRDQSASVDSIEINVEEAKADADNSQQQLSQAVRVSSTALGWGLAGAALGGVFGGPLGLWLGSKAGATLGLAVGGTTGAMGALGLREGIKKNHEKVADQALEEMQEFKRRKDQK